MGGRGSVSTFLSHILHRYLSYFMALATLGSQDKREACYVCFRSASSNNQWGQRKVNDPWPQRALNQDQSSPMRCKPLSKIRGSQHLAETYFVALRIGPLLCNKWLDKGIIHSNLKLVQISIYGLILHALMSEIKFPLSSTWEDSNRENTNITSY